MISPLAAGLVLILLALPVSAGEPARHAIDARRLAAWLDTPDPPLVLDVRGREAYLAGTLPGAFDAGTDPKGYLPDHSGDPVVLLVPDTLDPGRLARWTARLADAGHPVWLLTGGMAAWVEAGGAVEQPDAAYAQPGRVPFLIPRGLCEGGEPAQVFE
ncbi:MAG: rhodanese-like domain-containing protein [Candidatus Thiodiazotropha sp.]